MNRSTTQDRFSLRAVCLAAALALTLTPAVSMADQWNNNGHHEGQRGHDNGHEQRGGDWHAQGHQPNFAHPNFARPNYRWDRDHYTTIYHPTVVRNFTSTHSTVIVNNRTYVVNNGRFYEHRPEGWINIAAPLGWISATLPLGAVTLHIGGFPYFFADGIYYRHQATGYVVVSAPAPVYSTPTSQITTEISLLNVRTGPGLNFPVTETVPGNTSLDVYGSTPGWFYVRLQDNSYGWVMSQYTSGNGAAG